MSSFALSGLAASRPAPSRRSATTARVARLRRSWQAASVQAARLAAFSVSAAVYVGVLVAVFWV